MIGSWTVDLGEGPKPVQIPHAWGLEADLRWEGPAVYRCRLSVSEPWLLFHGVSFHAEVLVNQQPAGAHEGIWDAFAVDLRPWLGQKVDLEVRVTKNGGDRFPVKEVLSGFLPYVYGTWGGIFRPVELASDERMREAVEGAPTPPTRFEVVGHQVRWDGRPFHARGVLTWGWHPDEAHPHWSENRIREELDQVQQLGFNLVKFCLWMPPHAMLEEMDRRGLAAWLELPLWAPAGGESLAKMRGDLIQIVRQYRRHSNVLAWTIGCELSDSTPSDWRQTLVEEVQRWTGSPLVKDNSGGAEMYGGDPREHGSFDDFHPYCDLAFYAPVLESLMPGPRPTRPVFLGEFNDHDVIRDLPRVKQGSPYWASSDPALNDQGVRWQYDLPGILDQMDLDFIDWPHLIESSRSQSLFIRRRVMEMALARPEIAGWVITGWRDTPVSSAGFQDDWGTLRFGREELPFNNDPALFLIPRRRPPWIHGGNRPGWLDQQALSVREPLIQVGIRASEGWRGELSWRLESSTGWSQVGSAEVAAEPEVPRLALSIFAESPPVGELSLRVLDQEWRLWVDSGELPEHRLNDPWEHMRWPGGEAGPLVSIDTEASEGLELWTGGPKTLPRPFWREAAYIGLESLWHDAQSDWSGWVSVAPDCVLNPTALPEGWELIVTRIDARTFEKLPLVARVEGKLVTTLRPFGGLGSQPNGLKGNPAGASLLRQLLRLAAG